ncbi:MAG: HAD family hydrolase [Lachnospiraceae bacterium]|nr:HAD family hydrolase [Lachnospiraceae bacterium]
MRIGLYGMPTAGKSYILDKIDFIKVVAGSKMLHKICPNFESGNEEVKNRARRKLAEQLISTETFIMDGHYSFGDEISFTESDGRLYDVFLYLYISPEVLRKRMETSERNRRYLSFDLEAWQKSEIEGLRIYCHQNNKDFYVLDNPTENQFEDVTIVIDFIRAVVNGYSCVSLADKCVKDILLKSKSDVVTLMDGDKTITVEDSSNKVFGYITHLYDGNFYTGYQSWKQSKEFEQYCFDDLTQMPVSLNKKVCKEIDGDTYILTSGHERIWDYISKRLGVPYYFGAEMSAETKLYVTKKLQKTGKRVIAYGDSMNDYYMIKQADEGFLVTKKDSSISRSLKGKDMEGLKLV